MKVSTKSLLYIETFNVLFAVIWAASIPASLVQNTETSSVPLREKLCSENPTVNISDVCLAPIHIDLSSSTLKNFNNTCDHAVYLVQKLCEIAKSDINLTKDVAKNVTSLLSIGIPDKSNQFCSNMLKTQSDLGFADKSVQTLPYSCVLFCTRYNATIDSYTIKPLCVFMQKSWIFLTDYAKDIQSSHNSHAPSESNVGTSDGVNREQSPGGSKNMGTDQELSKPIKSEQPETPKIAEEGKGEEDQQPPPINGPSTGAGPVSETGKGHNPEFDIVPEEKAPKPGDMSAAQETQLSGANSKEGKSGGAAMPQEETSLLQSVKTPVPSRSEEEGDNPNIALGKFGNDDENLPPSDTKGDQNSATKPKKGTDKGEFDDDPENPGGQEQEGGEADQDDQDFAERDDRLRKIEKITHAQSKEIVNTAMDDYNEAEDSHFFVFFFIATFICILFYLIYQNKRKIIAMALEGKKGRHTGRRRPTSASYQKLDNKLDEVMSSSPPPSKTHVIY